MDNFKRNSPPYLLFAVATGSPQSRPRRRGLPRLKVHLQVSKSGLYNGPILPRLRLLDQYQDSVFSELGPGSQSPNGRTGRPDGHDHVRACGLRSHRVTARCRGRSLSAGLRRPGPSRSLVGGLLAGFAWWGVSSVATVPVPGFHQGHVPNSSSIQIIVKELVS